MFHPRRELVQSRGGRSPSLGPIAAALLPDLTSILTVEADGPGKPPARTMFGPRLGRSRYQDQVSELESQRGGCRAAASRFLFRGGPHPGPGKAAQPYTHRNWFF